MSRRLCDLLRGIKRHPWQTAVSSFAAFSVLWTLTQSISYLISIDKIKGPYVFAFFVAASLGYGLWLVWKPTKITIKVADTSTKIEVRFGELFAVDGVRAIAVTEFFDTALGDAVSEKSLHGLFIKKLF